MATDLHREPWNKGVIVGQQLTNRDRELALFNLGVDSKLRACDLVGYE